MVSGAYIRFDFAHCMERADFPRFAQGRRDWRLPIGVSRSGCAKQTQFVPGGAPNEPNSPGARRAREIRSSKS